MELRHCNPIQPVLTSDHPHSLQAHAMFAKAEQFIAADKIEAAYGLYERVAEMETAKSSEAQYECGILLLVKLGRSTEYMSRQDYIAMIHRKANAYFQRAASNGILKGNLNLGEAYLHARGVHRDTQIACDYFTKATNDPDIAAFAHYCIGRLYTASDEEEGATLEPDDEKAYFNFHQAYEKGYIKAAEEIAECFRYGRGVRQDNAQALHYYREAASESVESANLLWRCYTLGELGARVDFEEAE